MHVPLDFNPAPSPPSDVFAFTPTWLDTLVPQILERGHDRAFSPSGVVREDYLDLAEQLVRSLAHCQNQDGAVIDPVAGAELTQTSPRFVASGAVLLHFGRADDLREAVYRGIDWCCMRLASGMAQSPDFWLRELMTAWFAIAADAPADRRARWERDLRSIDPERIYWQVAKDGKTPADLHNWTIYASAGEAMRHVAGLGPTGDQTAGPWGEAFYEKYVPLQLRHFTNEGMYRDPGDPFTYDMTTRLQFATPLAYGFQTSLRPSIEELLRRGGLAQLLYVSPEGFAPFGGRSSQFHMQEAILAALGELEARRYRTSNPRLAGAFKRQARLSAVSMRRWLAMSPHRHLKNGFPPVEMHGCEPYAGYAMYSLFTASCLGLAALYADDLIAEAPMPAEIGGYVAEFSPAFHKIFAVCGQTQIEIDTAADPKYDATGLGRFHVAGVPIELGLFAPFTPTPNFRLPPELMPAVPVAIGPAWRESVNEPWQSLAAMGTDLLCDIHVDQAESDEVSFQLTWRHIESATVIWQHYDLTAGKLTLRQDITINGRRPEHRVTTVPLFESDGDARAGNTFGPMLAFSTHLGHVYEIHFPQRSFIELHGSFANRNGQYRDVLITAEDGEMIVTLRLK